jgi:hypothetical protein
MPVEATIRGRDFLLVIRVDAYEYPAITAGDDANWLTGAAELTLGSTGSYRGRQRVALRTGELERFRDELRVLTTEFSGEARLEQMEEQLAVSITFEAGSGGVAGYVRENFGPELRFANIDTDRDNVWQALGDLEEMVRAFPVRREP